MPSGRRGRVLTARIEGHCTPWVATRRSCFAEATRPHVTLIMTTHTFLIIFLATRTSIHDSLLIRLVFIRHYSSVPSRRGFILHFFFPFLPRYSSSLLGSTRSIIWASKQTCVKNGGNKTKLGFMDQDRVQQHWPAFASVIWLFGTFRESGKRREALCFFTCWDTAVIPFLSFFIFSRSFFSPPLCGWGAMARACMKRTHCFGA